MGSSLLRIFWEEELLLLQGGGLLCADQVACAVAAFIARHLLSVGLYLEEEHLLILALILDAHHKLTSD